MKKLLLASLAPLLTFASSPIGVNFSTDTNAHNGKIVVSVTNNSEKDIELLKWNTPFEKTISADIFDVHMGKKDNAYTGRVIKRTQPQDNDYMLLEAGVTEKVTVDMPTYYGMKKKGDYRISFDGTFNYRLIDGTEVKRTERTRKVLPNISLSFMPTARQQRAVTLKQTAAFNGCSQNETQVLKVAHDDAIKISKESMDVLNNAPKKTTSPRYVTWFGSADEKRQKTVTEGFQKIYDAFENKNISFDCGTCKADTSMYDSTYAYVYPDSQYQVYLCGAFWSSKTEGTDSQAGTLVHEVSHFTAVAGTDDHAYGQEDAKALAKNTPEKAVNNAENYDYFAENNPNLSMESSDGSNDNEENNTTSTDDTDTDTDIGNDNNSSTDTDEYDYAQEEADLDKCYEIEDDTKFEECFVAWENEYYPNDENDTEDGTDDWDWNDAYDNFGMMFTGLRNSNS